MQQPIISLTSEQILATAPDFFLETMVQVFAGDETLTVLDARTDLKLRKQLLESDEPRRMVECYLSSCVQIIEAAPNDFVKHCLHRNHLQAHLWACLYVVQENQNVRIRPKWTLRERLGLNLNQVPTTTWQQVEAFDVALQAWVEPREGTFKRAYMFQSPFTASDAFAMISKPELPWRLAWVQAGTA